MGSVPSEVESMLYYTYPCNAYRGEYRDCLKRRRCTATKKYAEYAWEEHGRRGTAHRSASAASTSDANAVSGGAANGAAAFEVLEGSCEIVDGGNCVQTKNYGSQSYPDRDNCKIKVSTHAHAALCTRWLLIPYTPHLYVLEIYIGANRRVKTGGRWSCRVMMFDAAVATVAVYSAIPAVHLHRLTRSSGLRRSIPSLDTISCSLPSRDLPGKRSLMVPTAPHLTRRLTRQLFGVQTKASRKAGGSYAAR